MSGLSFAFVLFKYFPHGGLQRDFCKFAREALARGHRVTAYAPDFSALDAELCATRGFEAIAVPRSGFSNHRRDRSFSQNVQRLVKSRLDPTAEARSADRSVDLILGFNKMRGLDAYYAADSCYVAKVAEQRSRLYRLLPRYRTYRSLERAVFARGRRAQVLAISKRELARYRRLHGTEGRRTLLLPPGIEPDRIAAGRTAEQHARLEAAGRDALGLAPTERLLLFLGSGFRKKGLDRALRAFAALPDAVRETTRLLVAGADNGAPFQRLARRLGVYDRVIWSTSGRDDVPACLAATDGLILPAYDENTGTVILEAMLGGVPVLVTENCGYAFYVDQHETGLVCPEPFEQTQLDALTLRLLTDPARERWRANGRAQAEQPIWSGLATAVVDELERLVRDSERERDRVAHPVQGAAR